MTNQMKATEQYLYFTLFDINFLISTPLIPYYYLRNSLQYHTGQRINEQFTPEIKSDHCK